MKAGVIPAFVLNKTQAFVKIRGIESEFLYYCKN